jgi:L-Ala-D/L-Glu epimerase
MKLQLYHFDLPLRHVFTIARESIAVQPTLIVELEEQGVRGYGEATTNPYYGATIENMTRALLGVREELQRREIGDPAELWQALHPALKDHPFAHCALDQAAHDLWGKRLGQPVYRLWGLTAERLPLTNYTIGIDTIDVMVEKMREFPKLAGLQDQAGHRARSGNRPPVAPPHGRRVPRRCQLRLDGRRTLRNAEVLKTLNVEFIEQPLAADRWDDMRRVYSECALPVIADESCIVPADVDRCAGHFHGINIKLPKCGGLTPARRMIQRARELQMRVMVGCMTESTVGISAIAQLLPLLDYVDMDGALLLAEDIATGVRIDQGRCIYPPEPGHGIQLTALPS